MNRLGRQTRGRPAMAMVPLVPIALSCGMVASLWIFRAPLASALVSRLLGLDVNVKKLDLSFRDESGPKAVNVSMGEITVRDGKNRTALSIGGISLTAEAQEREQERLIQLDIEVTDPQATVYFENYALTRNNWRSLLESRRRSAAKRADEGDDDVPVRTSAKRAVEVDDDGHVKIWNNEVATTVRITGGVRLQAFSEPLDNQRIFDDVDIGVLTVRPADFRSLEKTVEFVEMLTAKALLTLDSKTFPSSLKKNLVGYAKKIVRQEGKDYIGLGRVKIRQLDSTLQGVDAHFGNVLDEETRDALKTGRNFLRGLQNLLKDSDDESE